MASELEIIERIRRRAAKPLHAHVRLGIGDDCAILQPPPGHDLVVTTDLSLEGVHFRRDWHPARSVGHRVLARGLSDIAAMGAKPMAAFLSLALPKSVAKNKRWLNEFLDGFLELAREFNVTLAGGDTSGAPNDTKNESTIVADITVLGFVETGMALRRSGARPGDEIYCTGTLGGSAQQLKQLEVQPQRFADATRGKGDFPNLYPEPRIAVGRALLQRNIATSCMDISDGLSTDIHHLCDASGVSAQLELDLLPRHKSLRSVRPDIANENVLSGGEDYELLFTARPSTQVPKKIGRVPLTRIGTIVKRSKNAAKAVMQKSGQSPATTLERGGWEHLK